MNCAEANKVDLVDYLYSLGFTSAKISGNDYWYLSPLRDERTASFKVNRNKNVWYDHGTGDGGTLIDFATQYFKCDVQTVLEKISSYTSTNISKLTSGIVSNNSRSSDTGSVDIFNANEISFQQQNNNQQDTFNHIKESPFHLHENSLMNHTDAAETAIQIIAAKQPITNPALCRYLKERRVDKQVADKYCHEVRFKMNNNDKEFVGIGFKNNAGGYELRNEFFKLGSAPKYVTYIDSFGYKNEIKTDALKDSFNTSNDLKNEEQKDCKNFQIQSLFISQKEVVKSEKKDETDKQNQPLNKSKSIAVFEGFFDFLTYQTIHQNQQQSLTNFLVLNSLSFFERSLLLMEKHDHVYLYLDHDVAGRICVDLALKRSIKFEDKSGLYKGYKDLNDWSVHFGKLQKSETLKQSKGMRF